MSVTAEGVKSVFQQCDTSGTGFISRAKLLTALRTLDSENFWDREFDSFLQYLSVNEKGELEYARFVDFVFGTYRKETRAAKGGLLLCSEDVQQGPAEIMLSVVDTAGSLLGTVDVVSSHCVTSILERLRLRAKQGLHAQLYFGGSAVGEDQTFEECGITTGATLTLDWVEHQKSLKMKLCHDTVLESMSSDITVTVVDTSGRLLGSVEVVPSHCLSQVLEHLRLRAKQGLHAQLFFCGVALGQDQTFEECGIANGASLTLDWVAHEKSLKMKLCHDTVLEGLSSDITVTVVDTSGCLLGTVDVVPSHPVSLVLEHIRLRQKEGLHAQLILDGQDISQDKTFEECGVTSGSTLTLDWRSANS
eukprot:TRINITY_DN29008_c0_g2_i1.p1 TRINITY_DN29008_c0_g2~~TRINITY_DN29008_c0_g2_i1.p1  ORF type:complete len:362 (+),score=42.41 TRINITY_DN29008_c0_g2_i1:53-1138(+)